MTRLLNRRTRYVGKHRAEEISPPRGRRGRHAAARPAAAPATPGARRAELAAPRGTAATRPRWRRRAPYAAAGLLALTGAVTGDLANAGRARPAPLAPLAAPAPAPAAQRIRPAAARPVVLRVAPTRPAPRASRATRTTRTRTVVVYGATYRGRATWYGPGFAGRRTASGEVFRPRSELTAAHRWLPFGTRLRVCRAGRCVIVRINDRGPFGNAILDLSQLAAERLGMIRAGIAPVTATVVTTRVVRSAA